MYSKELLKGTIEIIILKLLVENGSMYGYEITQQVKNLTKGKIVISEGALYPTLHKLEAIGVLSTEIIHIGRRQRKYYHVSEVGKDISALKMQELSSFLHSLNQILDFKLSS
ncbi:DNA-binding transcriptional regulator, PadR family [Chitinophaga sp. YR627]|uniref:PadR family transcriptional regulator n=1 Tax=Chitinophaga sp. YR627 TaxID=1881041 RepID=UPI0008ED934F|nr:PadR family transcriptional regulator [Chitinophaga sp. YR627]SFN25110.1 DNA-binding transcriptional regulator, PadR family [Chitinophaga sp. YR627]